MSTGWLTEIDDYRYRSTLHNLIKGSIIEFDNIPLGRRCHYLATSSALWFHVQFVCWHPVLHPARRALDNKTIADFMSRLEESKLYNNINLKTIKQQKVNKLNLKSFEIGYVKASLKKPEKKTVVGSKPGKK